MKYPKNIWDQLKNKTCDELVRALKKDGWSLDMRGGSEYIFRKKDGKTVKRVSIHVHPGKTYGANLLKSVLDDIGWSIEDMRKLKLVK